ncbi:MAG: hypothetical protein VKK97_12855 [Synechococcaceae cyanobacterium]|nr:hypothetical protein [Synechococcaceae cyanobacterium]
MPLSPALLGRSRPGVALALSVFLVAVPLCVPGATQAPPTRQQAQALDASGQFLQAAQAWQALLGADTGRPLDHDRALALVRLLISLRASGEDARADALLPRLRTIDKKAVQPGDVLLPNAFRVLASIEYARQRQDLANALYTQGYLLSVAGLGEDNDVSRDFIWGALAMQFNSAPPEGEGLSEAQRREMIQGLARELAQPSP